MAGDWETQKDIFYDALDLAVEERGRFLDEACGSDSALREEIERLIEYHAKGREFFFQLEQELGSADTHAPLLEEGERVAGRFDIRRFLARGGFAEVYEAFDRELEERVALKVLRGSWISPESVERFKTEIRLARKIQNSHVCRVHDVGRFERPGGPPAIFFSMELLEGETLAQRLRRAGPLSKAEALGVIRQLAEGLQAAHGVGVLHRDLKSANVMLVPEGGSLRAVLTDFGLAISPEADLPKQLAGTPAYMAPEQFQGGVLSARTDVYALGVIACEMATGRLPFPGPTAMEQAEARLSTPPAAPNLDDPAIGRRWEAALRQCLAPDSADRFGNARDFAAALDTPHRTPLLGIAILLALIAGFGAWEWRGLHPEVPISSGSVLVVPFQVDGDAEKWRGEALSQDLTAELADVPGIRVAAQGTAGEWTGKSGNLAQIRSQLRVASVLSGSIHNIAGALRLTVQLADSASGYLRWSRSFDAAPNDMPYVEETIVLASVEAMQVRMPAMQVATLRNRHSQVPEAYQAYLFGQYCMARRNTQDLEQAIHSFQRATELDQNYALAYAGLATAYNMIATRGFMASGEAYRLSEEAAARALAMMPELPEALLVKGSNLQYNSWDWDGAEHYLRRCTEVAPGLGMAHHWLAGLLSIRGRYTEALAEAAKARDLDPLSPSVNASYGTFLFRARQYDRALTQLERVVKGNPAFMNAKLLLAEVYSQLGRPQDAVLQAETVEAAVGRPSYVLAELGYYYARAGRLEEARKIGSELETREAKGEALPSEVAGIYRGLGDFDTACAWLEKGYAQRDVGLTMLKADPAFDMLLVSPRFRALIDSVKL